MSTRRPQPASKGSLDISTGRLAAVFGVCEPGSQSLLYCSRPNAAPCSQRMHLLFRSVESSICATHFQKTCVRDVKDSEAPSLESGCFHKGQPCGVSGGDSLRPFRLKLNEVQEIITTFPDSGLGRSAKSLRRLEDSSSLNKSHFSQCMLVLGQSIESADNQQKRDAKLLDASGSDGSRSL